MLDQSLRSIPTPSKFQGSKLQQASDETRARYLAQTESNPMGGILFFALTFGSLFTMLNIMGVFDYITN